MKQFVTNFVWLDLNPYFKASGSKSALRRRSRSGSSKNEYRSTALVERRDKYEITNFFYFYSSFRMFYHGSRTRFFLIGSGFLADSDPDSGKIV